MNIIGASSHLWCQICNRHGRQCVAKSVCAICNVVVLLQGMYKQTVVSFLVVWCRYRMMSID